MRSVTFVVSRDGGFTGISREFCAGDVLTREAIRQFNVLEDGTVTLAFRIEGDIDRARRVLDDHPDVMSHDISGDGGSGDAYVRIRPPETVERILRIPREHEVMFEYPLEIQSTGTRPDAVRGTMIAETDETLQRGIAALPDEVDVVVERVGPHRPDESDASSGLTERQREVLEVAIDMGYYESPRRATHADIAERVGLDPSTVSKHLQRIEARKLAE